MQVKVNDVLNLNALESFVSNVHHRKPAAIRIVNYTTEGDPIHTDLTFDGHHIQYTFDNSKDKFGGTGKGRQSTVCSANIVKQSIGSKEEYHLTGCEDDQLPSVIAIVPAKP